MIEEESDFDGSEEEEAPDSLQKKWDSESLEKERSESNFKPCPHCEKMIQTDSFSCIYCGETVFEESGVIGRLGAWIKKKNSWVLLFFLILIFMVLKLFL